MLNGFKIYTLQSGSVPSLKNIWDSTIVTIKLNTLICYYFTSAVWAGLHASPPATTTASSATTSTTATAEITLFRGRPISPSSPDERVSPSSHPGLSGRPRQHWQAGWRWADVVHDVATELECRATS